MGFVAVVALAALGGAFVAGQVNTTIGPFDASVSLRPSWTGDTLVRLGPLGSLLLDTHDGVVGIAVDARDIHLDEARRFVENPERLAGVDDTAARDAERALRIVGLRASAGALVAALAVVLLRRATRRRAVAAAAIAIVTIGSVAVAGRLSWDRSAIAEPRYTGLLTIAPQAVGSLEDVQERFEAYQQQLTALVGNVALIYNTAATLPVLEPERDADVVKLLHVSDLHLNPGAFDLVRELVKQFDIDVVVDTGDINDWGTVVEARFVEQIASLGVPYVFVRGNHDSAATASAVAAQPNAVVLDDTVATVAGVRIWGIGDPRFTPDKTDDVSLEEERRQADRFAPHVARRVDAAGVVDIAVMHDPRAAASLDGGVVPLVLAGHLHKPTSRDLDGTLLIVEGSTGGAGLRGLEAESPVPLTATVLHFSRNDRRLQAFDRITVAGLGGTGARIQRHLVTPPDPPR